MFTVSLVKRFRLKSVHGPVGKDSRFARRVFLSEDPIFKTFLHVLREKRGDNLRVTELIMDRVASENRV